MEARRSKCWTYLGSSKVLAKAKVEDDKSYRLQKYTDSIHIWCRTFANILKTSDMIIMILDATKRAEQRALLEAELDAVGIRLNQDPPNIYLKQKKAGGMKITFQAPPKYLDEKMLYNILRDYRILNCEVLVRDENGQSNL